MTTKPRADQILADLRQRYSVARTYEDKGVLVHVSTPVDGSLPSTNRITFETAFDRVTGSFRFEYTHTHDQSSVTDRNVVWRRGLAPARQWWTTRPMIRDGELQALLGTVAGVSLGTSMIIPPLLLDTARYPDPTAAYTTSSEMVRGTRCFKLSSRMNGRESSWWVGQGDHILYRCAERLHLDGTIDEATLLIIEKSLPEEHRGEILDLKGSMKPFDTVSETEYHSAFDQVIDDARFDFVPPAVDGER